MLEFEFHPLQNQMNNIHKLEVIFQDLSVQTFELKKLDQGQNFILDPKISDRIVFMIKDVFQNEVSSGGSFNLKGIKCIGLSQPKKIDPNQKISVGCGETLYNHSFLNTIKILPGNSFLIECPQGCLQDKENVFGDVYYTDDTSICAGALHAISISELKGGAFTIKITDPLPSYKASLINGIQSKERKKMGEFSISYMSSDQMQFKPFIGQQVDVMTSEGAKEGILTEFKKADDVQYNVKIKVNGRSKLIETDWPSANVLYCGTELPKRLCNAASKNPLTKNLFSLNICFTQFGHCSQGYLVDYGAKVADHDQFRYGWLLDNRDGVRCNNNRSLDSNLKCLALFTPRHLKKCQAQNNLINCQAQKWMVEKVPNGTYQIRIIANDESNTSKQSLQVNGISLFDKKQLHSGSIISSEKITVTSGMIEITDDCLDDCEEVWTRISLIEIQAIIPKSNPVKKEYNESVSQPLNGIKGGDCYNLYSPFIHSCIYDQNDVTEYYQKIRQCTVNFLLLQIPPNSKAPSLENKFICIKQNYKTAEECENYCYQKCRFQIPYFHCHDKQE